MRIYFDACCLSRLTDDQSQPRIRAEAESIARLLDLVTFGRHELISSEALEDEVLRNPSIERREYAASILELAAVTVTMGITIQQRARALNKAGYGGFDAPHIAAAESAKVDTLLSTDDGMIKKAVRGLGSPGIPIKNPLSWSKEQ